MNGSDGLQRTCVESPVIHPGDVRPLRSSRLDGRPTTSSVKTQACRAPMSASVRAPFPFPLFLLLRKKRLMVPGQLNRVAVPEQRAPGKNTTVLNQKHAALFSCFESSGAGAGWEQEYQRTKEGRPAPKRPRSGRQSSSAEKSGRPATMLHCRMGRVAANPEPLGLIPGRSQLRWYQMGAAFVKQRSITGRDAKKRFTQAVPGAWLLHFAAITLHKVRCNIVF
jgi:hypothetical protein